MFEEGSVLPEIIGVMVLCAIGFFLILVFSSW